MNSIGREGQLKGKRAEERVAQIVQELGLPAYYETKLDFGGHTDLVVRDVRLQISATGKGKEHMKRWRREGIHFIIAGEHVSRDSIIQQIYLAINGEI